MALTSELLAGNAATSGLTQEQIAAIVEMSQNDENAVIAKKTGEIYGGLDADILGASGIAKNGIEKTFDYAKRVIGEIKTKADSANELQSTIATLQSEKARLEKAVAEGADAETKRQLAQAKADLENVTKSYTTLKNETDGIKEAHEKEIFGMRLDNEFEKASSSLKFKAGFDDAVKQVLIGNVREKIKGMSPEYIDDGKGGKLLAFKGADGAIMRNPENNLNPYTASELFAKELKQMGVLEVGKKTEGAGSHGGGRGTETEIIEISAARTQVEADEIITKMLLSKGITIGSLKFQEEKNKIWKDNNVKALPIR